MVIEGGRARRGAFALLGLFAACVGGTGDDDAGGAGGGGSVGGAPGGAGNGDDGRGGETDSDVARGGGGGGANAANGGSAGGDPGGGGSQVAGAGGGGGNAETETVPLFVASGMGARTVVSCDDGRTWVANQFEQDSSIEHSPWTEKGLAYGAGTFMQLVGWGAPGTVRTSRDGVAWKNVNLPLDFGGLAYAGDQFVVFVQQYCMLSKDRGETWEECGLPMHRLALREGGGGGRFLAGGGTGDTPVASADSGRTWKTATACGAMGNFGNLGHKGGIAQGNGALVIVSEGGEVCRSTDGVTWSRASLGGACDGKFTFTAGKFWAPNGTGARVSTDGRRWTTVSFQPAGTIIHAVAASETTGTLVGIQRTRSAGAFFRSTDGGNTWQRGTGPAGQELRRVVFGLGRSSAQCPPR